jgi:hypothetical protein
MSAEKLICGFCGRECTPEQDVGYLKFPDGKSRPAHLSHAGVKSEYESQQQKENS